MDSDSQRYVYDTWAPFNWISAQDSKIVDTPDRLSWMCAQDGKISLDPSTWQIVDVNPAMENLTGYSRMELLGMYLPQLAPPEERELLLREFSQSTSGPGRYRGFHAQRNDGHILPIHISTSGVRDIAGHAVLIAEFRDITDRESKQRALSSQSWALSALSRATLALCRTKSERELLQCICEAITSQSVYVLAFVGIAEETPEKLIRFAAASGPALEYLHGLRLSWADGDADAQGPSGMCIRTGQMHIVNDLDKDPSFERWRRRTQEFGVRSGAGIPIAIEGGWKGALVIFSADSYAFDTEPVQMLQRLGEQIMHGVEALRRRQLLDIEHRKLESAQKKLTEVLSATVTALVTTTEMRDPYTAGHQTRVAQIAVAIGRELGWDESRLMGLQLGALVHDIGKIAIPAEILTKPGKLSHAEMELVKAHPETGFVILKDIPFGWPVAEMVRQHHERLDGSGYPFGIKGDEILPESKVLAVADVLEAMTADRPYRRACGLPYVLAEIERQAGSLFDEQVVRACAALFRQGRLHMPGLN